MSLKLTRHQQTIYMLESTLMIAKVTPEYLSQQVQVVTLIPNQCLVYLGYVPVYVLIVTADMLHLRGKGHAHLHNSSNNSYAFLNTNVKFRLPFLRSLPPYFSQVILVHCLLS